jgi:adenine-specific DNA-methyltransferase
MPNIFIDKLIADFSLDNLTAFFRNKISSFYSAKEDLRFLFDESKFEKYSTIEKIGEATIDSDELIIICSKTTEPITERTGKKRQYDIAKKVLKQEVKDAAFFIFYDDKGNFIFSFVRTNYLGNRRDFTDFKRYTYFVSPTLKNNTFKRQIESCNFTTLDEIIEAFSVEPLNKQFYQEIAKAFYTLIGGTVKINNRNIEYSNVMQLPSTPIATNRKIYQEFAVRLIGRTIFCWFLKNKKSKSGIPLVPESWLSSKAVERIIEEKNNYYHSILEKLFFLVLNRKISERAGFLLPDEHELIPFLNGGLFDPHINDFFIADQPNYALEIPNKWFLELFEVLEQFNFTIDENSIFDAEVSIDPEMLGTIFENLLAEIDPDTEKSARNATGSFYTPREIVDYMVEQSLIQYLKTNTGITDNDSLTQLFKEGGENKFDNEDTETILKAISKVKILDPACGSGAFPMGAVSKIILALKKLDPGAKWWREQQVSAVPNAIARKKLKEKLDAATSDYARKLGVIQNSIYGVDIQPIAAEISKLRSFLSLVIDENIDDNAVNRGIEPLPNLEFKFVTANTLIDLAEKVELKDQTRIDFGDTESLQVKLQEIRNSYLQAYGEDKETLKKEFKDTQNEIFNHEVSGSGGALNKRAMQLASWNPFGNESNEWFNPQWMFGVDKFDIVIGNPPYVDSENMVLTDQKNRDFYSQEYETTVGNWDLFVPFIERGIELSNITTYIVPNKLISQDYAETIRKMIINQNLIEIRDYSRQNVFPIADVYPITFILQRNKVDEYNVKISKMNSLMEVNSANNITSSLLRKYPWDIFFFGSDLSKVLIRLLNEKKKFGDIVDFLSPCTVSEAYIIKDNLIDKNKDFGYKKLINSGTIDKYISKWGRKNTTYIKSTYSFPCINNEHLQKISYNRFNQANQCKIIIANMTQDLEAFIDVKSEYLAGKSTVIGLGKYEDLLYVTGLINSSLISKLYKTVNHSTKMKGGALSVTAKRISELPLIENKYYSKIIIEKVIKIIDEIDNESEYLLLESQINILVFKLYNLNYYEVKLIDPQFPLSQTEYENFSIDEQ